MHQSVHNYTYGRDRQCATATSTVKQTTSGFFRYVENA